MQFISRESSTFGFSEPGSVLSRSLDFPGVSLRIVRESGQNQGHKLDSDSAIQRFSDSAKSSVSMNLQRSFHNFCSGGESLNGHWSEV
jgi:hypothetical protein